MTKKSRKQPKRAAGRPPLSIEWHRVGLGTVPDATIAKHLEVSPSTVAWHRKRAKIPAFVAGADYFCESTQK